MTVSILAWIALIVELFGNWVVGDRIRWGFLIKLAGSLLWLSVGILSAINGLTVSAIVGGGISIRNYLAWRRDDY